MLKGALPGEFGIDGPSSTDPAYAIRLRTPSVRPVPARLVDSPDASVLAGEIRIVVLDGASADRHDRLRQAGVSFVDARGVVHLEAPGLYVDREGLKPVMVGPVRRAGVDPYSDRASRVVRVLLMSARAERWTTSALASAADVDVSTASRVVRELRRRDLAVDEAAGQGRASRIGVVDPAALLRDWTRRYSWDDNRHLRVAAPVGTVARVFPRLAEFFEEHRWALSLQAGASFVAPHAEFDIVHVYVDAPVEAVALEHGWEPSPSGRLVLMEPRYGSSVWFQQQRFEDVWVVGPVQLVLDLWHYPVRGREQAEHLVETVLRPIWQGDEHE